MTKEMTTLGTYNDTTLVFTHDKKINLTDMWRAADGRRSQAPNFWLDQEGTKRFMESLRKKLNATEDCILETKQGKGGGTWGHYQLALAYAKYLSPEFHIWCNEVVKERIENEGVPKQAHQFQIPQTYAEALQLAADQALQLELQAPKVEAYDSFLEVDTTMSLSDGLKSIGLKPKNTIKWMRGKYLFYADSTQVNKPYQSYVNQGLFVFRNVQADSDKVFQQTRLTPKGLEYFDRMKREGRIPESCLAD